MAVLKLAPLSRLLPLILLPHNQAGTLTIFYTSPTSPRPHISLGAVDSMFSTSTTDITTKNDIKEMYNFI